MRTILSLLLVLSLNTAVFAQNSEPKPKEFLYKVTLAKKYHDEKSWTDVDRQTVGAHFQRLKEANEAGKIILAGRTDETNDKTFGIVIFYANDEKEALEFMLGDPAVKAGIMEATLHPYRVALIKK